MGFFFQKKDDKSLLEKGKDLLSTENQLTDVEKLKSAFLGASSAAITTFESISKTTDEIIKMDQRAASLVKNMGLTRNSASLLKRELSIAAIDIIKTGGDAETGLKIAQEILGVTNKNAMVSGEIITNINATSKVTGQSAAALQQSFNNVGMEAAHITEQMKVVVNTASSMGVNAQAVSALVVSNMDKMNKFGFSGGVKGLAEMASKSAAMRVDMSQVFGLAEELLSPERAIEVASAFQRLGASSSQLADPLKLMDMAQNNVPELQNQLAKLTEKYTYFDKTTKTFQIMPGARRELMAIEKEIGVSYENLTKMSIEGAKLKQKMSEISFSGLDLSEEQKQQVAQMAELKKNEKTGQMEYFVKFKDDKGNLQEKAFSELKDSQGALKEYLDKQKEIEGKSMQDIAIDQLGYADQSLNELKALNMGFATFFAGSKGADKFLETVNDRISKTFGKSTDVYSATADKDSLKKLKQNYELMDSAANELSEAAKKLLSADYKGAMDEIMKTGKDAQKLLNEIAIKPIKEGITLDAKMVKSVIDGYAPGFTDAVINLAKFAFDKVDDFIAIDGKISKLNAGDIVIGGTKLLPPKQPTNVDETKTALSSFTQEQLRNLGTTTNVNNNSNVSGDISLTLKIDAPNMNSQMEQAVTNAFNGNIEKVIGAIQSRLDPTLPMGTMGIKRVKV